MVDLVLVLEIDPLGSLGTRFWVRVFCALYENFFGLKKQMVINIRQPINNRSKRVRFPFVHGHRNIVELSVNGSSI